MAAFADLQKRLKNEQRSPRRVASQYALDEVLVLDSRAKLSPATMVDEKLRSALAYDVTKAASLSPN